jgi:uncharacterized protein (DUF58 family)
VRPALNSLLLAFLLAATAALFDAEPLWVPAVALAALAIGSVIWVRRAARGVTLRRSLGARRVIEDEPVSIVIAVQGGRVALPTASIVDPLLSGAVPLPAGRGPRRVRIEARFGRRGRRTLVLPRLRICDPLGLATREISAAPSPADDELLVLPRIEPIVTPAEGGGGAARLTRRGRAVLGAEVTVDGIRPLREGTSAARIFWPSIARGTDPQERRLTAGSESKPLVVLDPRGAADEEQLDAAVRATASLARALALSGGCGVLLPGDRRATELSETLAGWEHVHARLALLGGAAGPALGAVAHRRGPVVFVSARHVARLPQAIAASAGATRVLVVPGGLPGRQAMFAVAGCHGYRLSSARPRARPTGLALGGSR